MDWSEGKPGSVNPCSAGQWSFDTSTYMKAEWENQVAQINLQLR